MSELPPFIGFPKIYRLSRPIIITEKIDGTHGVIWVGEDGEVVAGSRSKWLFSGTEDNFGFAAWVNTHAEALRDGLGPGLHHGEWWGHGINRGYGLKEKRFSLFNTTKWLVSPPCCHVVPILWEGEFETDAIQRVLTNLTLEGSRAAPGFMNPEGIVLYHTQGNFMLKKTIKNDALPKGSS